MSWEKLFILIGSLHFIAANTNKGWLAFAGLGFFVLAMISAHVEKGRKP